jgi:hypothetical protein
VWEFERCKRFKRKGFDVGGIDGWETKYTEVSNRESRKIKVSKEVQT